MEDDAGSHARRTSARDLVRRCSSGEHSHRVGMEERGRHRLASLGVAGAGDGRRLLLLAGIGCSSSLAGTHWRWSGRE
jgi:hypothetical protein